MGQQRIVLPSSGKEAIIKTATARFEEWRSSPRLYRKPVLKFDNSRMFAELALVRMFEWADWHSAWLDTFGKAVRACSSSCPPKTWILGGTCDSLKAVDMAPEPSRVLETIYEKAGSRDGAFDVIAWRGNRVVFVEAKRRQKDKIRDTQRRWIEAALEVGVPLLIVEWDTEK